MAAFTSPEDQSSPSNHDDPHAIIVTFEPSSPSEDRLGAPSFTPTIRPSRPFYAEHFAPDLPFCISSERIDTLSREWLIAMRLCGYPDSSTTSPHYFTKSITYDPDWRRRMLFKNEHRLIPELQKLETREVWAVPELYYSGPRHDSWDQVVPANWDGDNVDYVLQVQDIWIKEILEVIAGSLSEEVIAQQGTVVPLLSNEQMQDPTEGGNGGAFANEMWKLTKAVEALEGVLGGVDAGGPRNWEAVQDMSDLFIKYAGTRAPC